MKKKFLLPFVLSLVIMIIVIIISLVLFPIDQTKHTYYEYISYLGSFIGGFIGPLITIIGFYYLYKSLKETNIQNRKLQILNILQKYEENIDNICNKKIFLKRDPDGEPFESTIYRCLIIENNNDELSLFYDQKCKSQLSNVTDSIEIRTNLYNIAKYLNTMKNKLNIDIELIDYYKIKYGDLVFHILNEKYYFTKKYLIFKESCNFKNQLEIIDNLCRDFYSLEKVDFIINKYFS